MSHIFIFVSWRAGGGGGGKVVSLLITFLGKVFHPATFFLFISSTHLQNFTGNTLKLRTHLTTQNILPCVFKQMENLWNLH